MPTVTPTFVHIGGGSGTSLINVTSTGTAGAIVPALLAPSLYDPSVTRFVPATATGGLPSPLPFRPWFDGSVSSGAGAFVAYSFVPGAVAGSLGGCWYNAGNGVGPDLRYMQRLYALHGVSPYFAAIKKSSSGPGISEWKVGGLSYTTFQGEWAGKIATAATARDITLDVKLIIVDIGTEDCAAWSTAAATYKADVLAMIAGMRSYMAAPAARVMLVMPHPAMQAVTYPGAAIAIREVYIDIARDLANKVLLVDRITDKFAATDTTPGSGNSSGNPTCHTMESQLHLGDRIMDAWVASITAKTLSTARGLPIYVLLGDSIAVGTLNVITAVGMNAASVLGPNYPSFNRPLAYIFNGTAQLWQEYVPGANSNTAGGVSSLVGPEATLIAMLAEKHPSGFGLVKYGLGGSALTDASTVSIWNKGANVVYPPFKAHFESAITKLRTQLGYSPDVLGASVVLGTNDCKTAGNGALFEAAIDKFLADLRADLTTRTGGKQIPIAFCRPHVLTRVLPSELASVRASIASRNGTKLTMVDVDGIEMDRGDFIHDSAEGVLERGRLIAGALASSSVD